MSSHLMGELRDPAKPAAGDRDDFLEGWDVPGPA